jgi:cell division protein FtsL
MHRTINWILMLATLASTFALYAIKDGTRRLEARVQAQERALERTENDVSVLGAERAHLSRPERLEPLARKLGLTPVSGGQYLRVDVGPAIAPPLAGESQGRLDRKTSAVGIPPTPNPSPRRVEDAPSARWGGEFPTPSSAR